jgi:hypothetical protein
MYYNQASPSRNEDNGSKEVQRSFHQFFFAPPILLHLEAPPKKVNKFGR